MSNHVYIILDSSGSMASKKAEVIEKFNSYVGEIDPDIRVTYVSFNRNYEIVVADVPANKVKLTERSYHPYGNTALYDALGRTYNSILLNHSGSDKVLVAVITDGQENASTKYNSSQVANMAKNLSALGFEIQYLSSDSEAFTDAKTLGTAAASTFQYTEAALVSDSFNHLRGVTMSYFSPTITKTPKDKDER